MTLAVVAWVRRYRFRLLLALSAVIGAGLVLVRQSNYGVTLKWDSTNYIVVARDVLKGNGFIKSSTGSLYTSRLPLYPMLLAAASLAMFDPHDGAGPLNTGIFGLTVFVAGRYLGERLESRFLTAWGRLAVW